MLPTLYMQKYARKTASGSFPPIFYSNTVLMINVPENLQHFQ